MSSDTQRPALAQRLLAALAGQYLRFALATTRWQIEGFEQLTPFLEGKPLIAAFWHQRIALMPALLRAAQRQARGREIAMLVSRHRDGRFIAHAMRVFGVGAVHGSAGRPGKPNKGGAAALRGLLEHLEMGGIIAITPDGPRGPAGIPAPGTAALARLSGAPILACSAQAGNCLTLKSWDRLRLPLPFGRGRLICGALLRAPPGSQAVDDPALSAALKAALDAAQEAADRGLLRA